MGRALDQASFRAYDVNVAANVTIPARFNGPPGSGNGGYSCGTLGALIGTGAEVTLRKPPPLDREMFVRVEGEDRDRRWRLLDAEALVAEGRAAELELAHPEPPSLSVARAAEAAYVGFGAHPFPTCFVCGPERSDGDGLRLFTGKVEGRDLVACTWRPDASVGSPDGVVDAKVVWSALDCPSYFGASVHAPGTMAVLGRLTVRLVAPLEVGAPHVVIGWPIGREGRKWHGGSALFRESGELCAVALGVWVELRA